ncbi:uncharacterized protein LOC130744586 [Lotus japonicus]|uniref:uncharacterized protein LOC130744586 n=1 Tax=Lotus japonicus TaxID=34305 RepID=UPI00258B12E1|nr:uncharacterized protein LOC130744586 [Lotus japonicus]
MVDNCYGEFVESIEPPIVVSDNESCCIIPRMSSITLYIGGHGADLIAGSLIKNPGGTIAPCGGYVAGRKKWVEAAAARLSAASVRVPVVILFTGVTSKNMLLVEKLLLMLYSLEAVSASLLSVKAIQSSSSFGSYTKPIAGITPGYAAEVIFADGTFIDGSTSELSCNGPLREPFAVFYQGGTHWTQWGLVLGEVLKSI